MLVGEVANHKNVRISPFIDTWNGGPDPSNCPLHARIVHKGVPVDTHALNPAQAPKMHAGKWLYGGGLYAHFGHIIQDTIIRLWAYRRDKYDGVIFPLAKNPATVPGYFFDIVSLFGLPADKCFFLREEGIFESVDFAEPGNPAQLPPADWYLNLLGAIKFRRHVDTPKSMFFGRVHLLSSGTFMGESYFARQIRDTFQYVKPEIHDISWQLSAIQNAERIVFTEGSSIFPAALLSKVSAEIYFLPRRYGGDSLFSSWLSARGSFHVLGDGNIKRLADLHGRNGPSSPSFLLNPSMTHSDMCKFGLLSNRSFDMEEYQRDEIGDTLSYFKTRHDLALKQIESIYEARRTIDK